MNTEKLNNEDVPTSMKMPINEGLSEASKHLKKEVDAWLKEGKKTIIPTKEQGDKWRI